MEELKKVERKYLAHFIDAAFDTTFAASNYVRLGKDLEEYAIELNPDIETKKNILGETSVNVNGYEPQSSVDTYYAYYGDSLFEKMFNIANNRSTGSEVKTSVVDVLIGEDGTVESAYREDVIVEVQSIGGGNGGVNVPFAIHYNGNRTKGTWDLASKTFTADES